MSLFRSSVRESGDGFVVCSAGHRHWGTNGAAGLLLIDPERGVLLQHRASWTHQGGTWALPGGAIQDGESPRAAAIREAGEEADVAEDGIRVTSATKVDHGGWSYTTVLATVSGAVRERVMNAESAELRWVSPEEVAGFPLHQDFAAAWPELHPELGRQLVLVVDAANVVGARPDGWWRDRAGAAARLRDRLGGLVRAGVRGEDVRLPRQWCWWPRVRLVVEGQARRVGPGSEVEVVAAERDGDSAIVETVRASRPGDHLVVVTADRELRSRVEAEGASVVGPSTLLSLLGS
ncbi:MAG TPA: NUDIX hydrolase [Amycolatopsis sp.]|uniref:NUDIX hydrolase n=1 Tax=Amycolatopsis sp. TaxID=37632 RepID=UPI002B49C803|nr:NUDIX hydrolase [Amycolatopsis sp.]HKS48640.1 NUDIX hydrolase [Amycolatopsis sp.]